MPEKLATMFNEDSIFVRNFQCAAGVGMGW